jgi:hypothetical protein
VLARLLLDPCRHVKRLHVGDSRHAVIASAISGCLLRPRLQAMQETCGSLGVGGGLSRVNAVVGPNASGKAAFLTWISPVLCSNEHHTPVASPRRDSA